MVIHGCGSGRISLFSIQVARDVCRTIDTIAASYTRRWLCWARRGSLLGINFKPLVHPSLERWFLMRRSLK